MVRWARNEPPRPPEPAQHLFGWFTELDLVRKSDHHGQAECLDYVQIAAWRQLRDLPVRDWEIAAIIRMDLAYLAEIRRRRDENGEVAETPAAQQVSSRPLSPELFDALFPGS